MGSDLVLKPGWLAEELNEAAVVGANDEVARAIANYECERRRTRAIMDAAYARLNAAYKRRHEAHAALARSTQDDGEAGR